jgi:hypothetical protein
MDAISEDISTSGFLETTLEYAPDPTGPPPIFAFGLAVSLVSVLWPWGRGSEVFDLGLGRTAPPSSAIFGCFDLHFIALLSGCV